MRNLSLVGSRQRSIDLQDVGVASNPDRRVADQCQSVVGDVAHTFVLTNDGIVVKLSSNGQRIEWMAQLDPLCEKPGGEWFCLREVDTDSDHLSLVCLSKNGGIVTVHPVTGEAELVGEFDHGLQAACFSPDGEVLCLLTLEEDEEDDSKMNSALLLMNTQWEVLAETTLERHVPYDETNPDSKVTLCWRPDGSLLALSTLDASDQTRKVRIYKRDNLQFHAIARLEDGSGKLVPHMVASAGIHWAGAGCSQLLAGVQRKGKKTLLVIFMEPNGNRHREFALREPAATTQVLGLAWNADSDLLAVTLRDTSENGGGDKVQLWHRSNYHWYMKQEFRYTEKVSRVAFDEEKPHLLYVFAENQCSWREYQVLWQPSSVQILAPKTCVAHVVDGCDLQITALDQALVPPPMSAFTLTMESPIRQVVLSNDATQPITAVVRLSDDSIVLLGNPLLHNTTNHRRQRYTTPQVVAKGSLPKESAASWRSLVLLEQTDASLRLLAICGAPNNGSNESLQVLSVTWDETATVTAEENSDVPLDQRVLCCVPWSDSHKGALLELEDGSLLEYDVESASLKPLHGQEFMEPCSWIAGIKNPSALGSGSVHQNYHHDEQKELVFGLSLRSRLFCQDVLLADAVSSFAVSMEHEYLCYAAAAGSTSQLRFLPLSDLQGFDALMGSDSNVILEGYEPRSVERGARLVGVMPASPCAVLQMPRGNLEGIYPRALLLRSVMKKIGSSQYGEAFAMMRRQKVNLNLIVDLNPHKFLEEGLAIFLKQVAAIDHLNLFISCLSNWDSTQHQYRIPPWLHLITERDIERKKLFDFPTKINQVCAKMRSLMIQAEKDGRLGEEGGKEIAEGHFLLPILTTFAKEDPPKLEEALTLIKNNAIAKSQQSTAAVKKPPMFSDAAQSSIQYLAFLADHELIFNVGLGLYDFDVARACARNSQMDPKVYLPLLKRLRSLPNYYARYEVDMRLKRYDKALRNLFESNQQQESLEGVEPLQDAKVEMPETVGNGFECCMALVEKHQLHGVGLELFQADAAKKRLVMQSLGEKLLKDGKASSALTVFLTTEPVDTASAKRAARACKDWQCFFTLVSDSSANGGSEEETTEAAAREIAEGISMAAAGHYNQRGDMCDAARILLDYCNDVDGAMEMYVKGWAWREGSRVATLHNRPDLVQHCIEAAVAFAESAMVDLEERKETFMAKNKRYGEVLEIRKEAIRSGEASEFQQAGIPDQEDNGSVFSAASNASNMSLQSTASTGSLSSFISIKSNTSFSITGREMETRHLSKWGPNGGNKQKKKNKKRKKNKPTKIRPGSPEELQEVVNLLKSSCVVKELGEVISETIGFLAQTGRVIDTARDLYKSYVGLSETIRECHTARAEAAQAARLAELSKVPVTLPCEETVDKLANEPLPESLAEVFSLLSL